MRLSVFIAKLLEDGNVTVGAGVQVFDENDLADCVGLLAEYHKSISFEMPGRAPAFHPEAALWGVKLVYALMQGIMIREIEVSEIRAQVPDFEGEKTPEIIFNVDLTLRYLPAILGFAKALAPGDELVKYIQELAFLWPFSSVGIEIEEDPDIESILSHPSLKAEYINRVLEVNDKARLKNSTIKELAMEALGYQYEAFGIKEIENTTENTWKAKTWSW